MLRVTGTGPRPLEALALAGLLAPAPGRVAGPGGAADALAEAAGSGPTLCLVDDADDLDDVSATVIASVMDRVDLTVFATSRPPLTGEQTLERMLARRESIVLRAMPVPFDEMQRIVGDVVGGEIAPGTTGRIYALSGGLPGVARAIAAEARRAGRLVFADGVWRTAAELWTPGLDMLAARLTRGLAEDEREALWPLAELGPAPAASARQLVPVSLLARLEDRGLLHVATAGGVPLIALFPPLLAELFRHHPAGIRGMQSAEAVAASLDSAPRHPRAEAPASPASTTSAETATVIGRLLREHLARELSTARSHWEHVPSDAAALAYVAVMLTSGVDAESIDTVLERANILPIRDAADRVELHAWEATYRSFVRHDPVGAAALLDETIATIPESAAALRAVQRTWRSSPGTAPLSPASRNRIANAVLSGSAHSPPTTWSAWSAARSSSRVPVSTMLARSSHGARRPIPCAPTATLWSPSPIWWRETSKRRWRMPPVNSTSRAAPCIEPR